jgi:hypothetical protein
MTAKKKFEHMSSNEWLGDHTTHFMKSGDAFRSPENQQQEQMARLIPKLANGVKVEYDIGYDIPGKIHGYKYTDFLTKAIYIAPCCHSIALENITTLAGSKPTDEGRRVFEALRQNISDKYLLDNDDDEYDVKELVVLPGTNLLTKDVVDLDKVDKLVSEGAYVKLHPITSEVWRTMLKNRWKERCIPADAPLYPILRGVEKVYFTLSSETGMAALLLGKKLGNINSDKPSRTNFEFIYRGLDRQTNGRMVDKFVALLSHPGSGIVTVYHDNPEQRINQFFEHMAKYPHK